VDIQHGLLDELRALDVITHQQFDEIRSQRTVSGRVNQLLNIVVQMPDAQQEQFLTALQNTQQIHVSELIRGKGNANTLNRDMWPVRCCMEWRTVNKNWVKLVELIDLKCGLLEELLSEGCITHRQMQTIKAGKTDADQNAMLLNVLSRRSLKTSVNCLIVSSQQDNRLLRDWCQKITDAVMNR
jgi:hypothetical protein